MKRRFFEKFFRSIFVQISVVATLVFALAGAPFFAYGETANTSNQSTHITPRGDLRPGNTFRDTLASGGFGPTMVIVPSGDFTMGSPKHEMGRHRNEGPRRRVSVNTFALGQTEVSFDDYDHFARITNRALPFDEGWGRGERPVIYISWRDAKAYADWLTHETGHEYRLPSEAEWEYAARAGTRTPYSTGHCISHSEANFADRSGGYRKAVTREQIRTDCPSSGAFIGRTTAVGGYPANYFGLKDMHGSVWEWVEDCWHDNYKGAPSHSRAWLADSGGNCIHRVLRGGSWVDGADNLRSAKRSRYVSLIRNVTGFRIARTIRARLASSSGP